MEGDNSEEITERRVRGIGRPMFLVPGGPRGDQSVGGAQAVLSGQWGQVLSSSWGGRRKGSGQ